MAVRDNISKCLTDSDDSTGSSEEDDDTRSSVNVFANDGSFMELFKRQMESSQPQKVATVTHNDGEMCRKDDGAVVTAQQNGQMPAQQKKTSLLSFVGKRRGGKVLPTGIVKKQKQEGKQGDNRTDAWSQYMDEVRKYKERSCEDEGKRRPLVK